MIFKKPLCTSLAQFFFGQGFDCSVRACVWTADPNERISQTWRLIVPGGFPPPCLADQGTYTSPNLTFPICFSSPNVHFSISQKRPPYISNWPNTILIQMYYYIRTTGRIPKGYLIYFQRSFFLYIKRRKKLTHGRFNLTIPLFLPVSGQYLRKNDVSCPRRFVSESH